MSHARPPRRTHLAFVIGLLLTGPAQAAVRQWNDPAGGSFTDAANWTPAGVPGSEDTARFNLGASASKIYVVTGAQGDIDRLVIGQDAVRFDFNQVNRLKLGSGAASAPSLVIGELAGQSGLLQLVDGGTLSAQDAVLGAVAGSRGELQVDGATLDVAGTLFVGSDGVGQLTVTNAGEVASRTVTVGSGSVNVQGSRLKVTGEFVLGKQSQATLDVTQGSEISSGAARIDSFAGGLSAASLSGAGSRWDIGGRLTVGGVGLGLLSLERGAVLTNVGTELDGPSDMGINSSISVFDAGSRWESRDTVDIGVSGTAAFGASRGGVATARSARLGVKSGSFGAASIRDAGSRWDIAESLDLGLLGRAALRVRAGGVVTARTLSVGSAGTVLVADQNSLLDISRDAALAGLFDLDAGGVIGIGGSLSVVDNGRIDADGTGATLRVGNDLLVGTSGAGAADVDIGTGSLLEVADSTSILPSGRVHLNGGTLRTFSLVNAGRFDFTTGLLDLTGFRLIVAPGAGVPGWFDSTIRLGPQQQLTVSRSSIEIDNGGEVFVDGAGAALNGGFLLLGRDGHGSLTVDHGGSVVNRAFGFIGNIAGSSGAVTVRGANSSWRSAGDIVVGNFGAGTLDVLDGGYVKSAALFVGGNAGTTGRARVAGRDSKIDVGSKLIVGLADEAALEIADGARVDVITSGDIGSQATGDAVVSVTGAGSLLSLDGPLTIGNAGKGELTVADGGRVENTLGTIGAQANSRGGVIVRGAASTWDNSSDLFVGDAGEGALTIEAGGEVLNFGAAIGNLAGGAGEVIVRGAGSTWTNRQVLLVGDLGSGSLLIEDGATVTNASFGFVGNIVGSTGEVTVTGAGSLWDSGGLMAIGAAGRGALNVLDGARVEAQSLLVGSSARGHVLVDGPDSTIATDGNVGIGDGTGGELTVRAGGLLEVGQELLLGERLAAKGDLLVDGMNSRVDVTGDFTVGVLGEGFVAFSGGAALTVGGNGEIAGELGSVGRVELTGAGTHWQNTLDLAVGLRGEGELEVADGATIATTANGLIGHQTGAFGYALITGSGSEWALGQNLFVGFSGNGDLTVADGAKVVTDSNGVIGHGREANGHAHITGAGSAWTLGKTLYVGNLGTGALTVADGALLETLDANDSWIGNEAGSSGTLEVTDTGTRAITDQLVVGFQGDGTLRVLDGAELTSVNGWIGVDSTSESSALISSGGKWLMATTLFVGTFGSGRLDVVDGGEVRTKSTQIAPGSGRASATIAGQGSRLINTGDFTIGNSFVAGLNDRGDVTVRDGGSLHVGGKLHVFDYGRFLLDGGSLHAGALDLQGSFEFRSGTIALTASNLRIGGGHGIRGFFEHSLFLTGDQHIDVVNGTAEVDAEGVLAVTNGASFSARGITNRGAVLVNGGTLHSTARFLNDGTLGLTDATLRTDAGLDNIGAMRLADARVIGDVHNEGAIVLAGSTEFTGALSGNGVYAGKGTAVLEGSLNPGNSPGLTQFGGNVEFGAAHTLTIELAGLSPGTTYDRIEVAGELTLAGTLEVALLDGYAPSAGDVFDIAIAAFIHGDFAARLLPTLTPGLRWNALQLSDALGRDLYRLEVSAVPVPPAVWLLTSACGILFVRTRRP